MVPFAVAGARLMSVRTGATARSLEFGDPPNVRPMVSDWPKTVVENKRTARALMIRIRTHSGCDATGAVTALTAGNDEGASGGRARPAAFVFA